MAQGPIGPGNAVRPARTGRIGGPLRRAWKRHSAAGTATEVVVRIKAPVGSVGDYSKSFVVGFVLYVRGARIVVPPASSLSQVVSHGHGAPCPSKLPAANVSINCLNKATRSQAAREALVSDPATKVPSDGAEPAATTTQVRATTGVCTEARRKAKREKREKRETKR